jgi:hypothetical protein
MSTSPKTEDTAEVTLSECSIEALENLGVVLKPIYVRMKREGYGIVNGVVVKINENE